MKSLIDPRTESAMKDEAKKARYTLGNNGYVKVLDSRSDEPSTTSRTNALPVPQINRKPWRQSQICRQPYVSGGSWKTICPLAGCLSNVAFPGHSSSLPVFLQSAIAVIEVACMLTASPRCQSGSWDSAVDVTRYIDVTPASDTSTAWLRQPISYVEFVGLDTINESNRLLGRRKCKLVFQSS